MWWSRVTRNFSYGKVQPVKQENIFGDFENHATQEEDPSSFELMRLNFVLFKIRFIELMKRRKRE
jgi:hypothetical protein